MTPLWKKLNLTTQDGVVLLNAPTSFASESQALSLPISVELTSSRPGFLLAFVTKREEIASIAQQLGKIDGDPVLWLAYPKGSSKNYQCDFNRDSGWEPMTDIGLRPVRQVAIDADWSALRFRNTAMVKSKK